MFSAPLCFSFFFELKIEMLTEASVSPPGGWLSNQVWQIGSDLQTLHEILSQKKDTAVYLIELILLLFHWIEDI